MKCVSISQDGGVTGSRVRRREINQFWCAEGGGGVGENENGVDEKRKMVMSSTRVHAPGVLTARVITEARTKTTMRSRY